MSWARIKYTGRGAPNYRLAIAGWPHEWATSIKITHAAKNGRAIYPSLQPKGLMISERASVREAWPEVAGMTFTIHPTTPGEETVNGFTRDPVTVGVLSATPVTPPSAPPSVGDIPATGFSTIVKLDTGATLPAGVYHIGTEALQGAGTNSLNRAVWDTVNEKHTALPGPVAVYTWPPTMEGRRAYLYAYGEADDPAGVGTQIWVGVVSSPPRMNNDGITWNIVCQHVISVLDQELAASDKREYKIRGVYHSAKCPLRISTTVFTGGYTAVRYPQEIKVYGFYETQTEWIAEVNRQLAGVVASPGNVPTATTGLKYDERPPGGPTITVSIAQTGPGGSPAVGLDAVYCTAASVLEGCLVGQLSRLHNVSSTDGLVGDGFRSSATIEYFGDASQAYVATGFHPDDVPGYTYPLPAERAMLGAPRHVSDVGLTSTKSAGALSALATPYVASDVLAPSFPSNRIYLNTVEGLNIGDTLFVRNGDKSVAIVVDAVNTVNRTIDATNAGGAVIYFDTSTVFIPLRATTIGGNLSTFLNAVVANSVNANDGDTPFVLDKDVDTASLAAAFSGVGIDSYWLNRNYTFVKPTAIKSVMTPELKLIGWMARMQVDGRVGFVHMPQLGANSTANAALTDASILPPADGMAGSWVEWASQPDGLVNVAVVKIGYDPITDAYNERFTYRIVIVPSVSDHKSNGKGSVDIEVKSTEGASVSAAFGAASVSIFPGLQAIAAALHGNGGERAAEWLATYLGILSTEYAVVTVSVPFTFFDQLVGNVLDVTCSLIPNGLGGRGVVSRKAYIVGREWQLDPASGMMGKLTLYFPRIIGAGYTPTGRVTGRTNTGGNTWVLQFSAFTMQNIVWAESGADVSLHFAVGDKVQVIQSNSLSPTIVTGTITAKDNTTAPATPTITVAFTGTWTPGALTWNLMWQPDVTGAAGLTSRQRSYCIVADTTKLLADGTYARKYT